MLEGEPDGAQLYRHIVHQRIPRLGFAGFNHGFMHVPRRRSAPSGRLPVPRRLALPPPRRWSAHRAAWKRAHIA